jgi:hypothetical protein
MSKHNKNSPSGDYIVGYGKPPASGRFQKGDGGNPKGRRRKHKAEIPTIEELLVEFHDVVERGKKRRMTNLEIIWRRQVAKAVGGDDKVARFLLGYIERHRQLPTTVSETPYDLTLLSDEELETLERISSKASPVRSDV